MFHRLFNDHVLMTLITAWVSVVGIGIIGGLWLAPDQETEHVARRGFMMIGAGTCVVVLLHMLDL